MSETKKAKIADPEKKTHKARLREIEVAKAEVELKAARADYEWDQIRLRNSKAEAAWKKAADRNHGVFNLDRSVGQSTVDLAAEIRQWARLNPGKAITLNIFSPGGSLFHGLVLYDTLRSLAKKGRLITTYVHGYAASMGSLLFLAGDVRIMAEESQVMFHALSAGTGGSLHAMEDDVQFFKRLNKRLDKIVTSRTKVTAEDLLKRSHKKDWWMDSRTAKRFGVATEID